MDMTRRTLITAPHVGIWTARPADAAALDRLAARRGTVPFLAPALIGAVDGRVIAALPVAGGPPLVDPSEPTGQVLDLLRARLEQIAA